MTGNQVVLEDYGDGWRIIGRREEGETDGDVRRRYARYIRDRDTKRRQLRVLARALRKWQP